MKLEQRQAQRLSQYQMQCVELLQMSAQELETYIQELALSNPVVELENRPPAEETESDPLVDKLRWLEETDRQNYFYQHMEPDERDLLAQAGTSGGLEETLVRFLSRQVNRLSLDREVKKAVLYLAACLDDDGYLRSPLDALARSSGLPLPRLEEGLAVLRSLEPAGVGAASLSQCLELQLDRCHEEGTARAIVRDHLEALARRRYRSIAAKLNVAPEEVRRAERIIRELEPRPGAIFQHPEQVPYIHPDIFVEEVDGRFVATTRRRERPLFQISGYYQKLLAFQDTLEPEESASPTLEPYDGDASTPVPES